jgi:hypothetical protein
MAPKKTSDRAGNTEELDRLEKEIDRLKDVQIRILGEKKSLTEENVDLTKQINELKKSEAAAYEKIAALETATELAGTGATAKDGYVEIATIPYKGQPLTQSKVDNIIVPQRKENGVVYERFPVKTALALLAIKCGHKRALIGPCDKIEGDVPVMQSVPHGIYNKHFVFNRHKVSKDSAGNPFFIEVTIEESKDKAE